MSERPAAGEQRRDTRSSPQPANQAPQRPWRTEGLPSGQDDGQPPRRFRWIPLAIVMLISYGLLFGLLTWQDQSNAATVSYTEFTTQVQAGNVAEVFSRGDTIQGTLRQARPVPDQPGRTYQQFSTERPTFAQDDLLTQLRDTGATVRATPVVEQRGLLSNLLISLVPLLLLVAFYYWLFKRQQQMMSGGIFGGGKRKPVDPETVRVTFDDVAGIDEVEAEINEAVDFLRNPDKYRRLGARAPKGVLLAAARRGESAVTTRDFGDALEKIQLGAERNVVMPPEQRRRTAYHEAGHAPLGMLQPGADPVRKVSIIPRGRSLGVTLSTPESDRYGYDERYLRGRIIGALGGMAAEEEVFGVVTTGAESDLELSTKIAKSMVGR